MGQRDQEANMFIDMIRTLVRQEISKMKIIGYEVGEVTNVNGSLIDVQLTGDGSSIANLLNKTGQTLIVGDEVLVYTVGSLTNAYVAVKFGA